MSAQKAKQVRDALKKELGLNSRQVSVRSPHWGSIYVTIKTADAKYAAVQEIARRVEHVRYCQFSGDILSGGNTFVTVEFDDAVINKMAESPSIVKAVTAALAAPGINIALDDTDKSLSFDRGESIIYIWNTEGMPERLWITGTLKYDCRAVATSLLKVV